MPGSIGSDANRWGRREGNTFAPHSSMKTFFLKGPGFWRSTLQYSRMRMDARCAVPCWCHQWWRATRGVHARIYVFVNACMQGSVPHAGRCV